MRTSELQGWLSPTLSIYRIQTHNLLVFRPVNPLASIQIGKTISKGIEFETAGRILPDCALSGFAHQCAEPA